MTNERRPDLVTPEDFPGDYGSGAVPGAQPKLLVRKVDEVYVSGLTEEERYARYDNCFDLVNQLEDYCSRKMRERPDWSTEELLKKVRAAVVARPEWDLSAGEIDWMMNKLAAKLNVSGADAASENAD